jgi:hypothetical protein
VFSVPRTWRAPDAEVDLRRRRLSSEETDELKKYVREQRQRRWVFTVAAFYGTALGVHQIVCGLLKIGPPIRNALAAAAGLLVAGWVFSRASRVADAFWRDAELGWVVVVDPAPAESTALTEVMPFSKALWRIAGQPAAWRHAEGARS